MPSKKDDKQVRQKSHDKPISLYPLTLDESLTELMKVKPPPEGWKENKKKSKAKK